METKKAAFMGKITAGVTHEIKNVLAIIKESGGLIEDLISFTREDTSVPKEKLLKTLTKIADQVNRGVELSTRLNEFAHTPDQELATVDLNSAVDSVVSLSQRFARLKRVRLEALRTDRKRGVVTDPLAFIMLIFSGIELLLNLVGENALISVKPCSEPGDGVMLSASQAETGATGTDVTTISNSEAWQKLGELAANLEMTVNLEGPPLRLIIGGRG